MTDYISRDAAIAAAFSANAFGNSALRDVYDTVKRIRMIPAEDVVERKYGKWIDHQYDGLNKSILYAIECSACNDVFTEVDPTEKPIKYKFCPVCGARMVTDDV